MQQEKLVAVSHDRRPYSTRYPHLSGLLSDNPAAPKYALIAHNLLVRCPDWLQV